MFKLLHSVLHSSFSHCPFNPFSSSYLGSILFKTFLLSPIFTTFLSFANFIISCLFFWFAWAGRHVSIWICINSLLCFLRHPKILKQMEHIFNSFLKRSFSANAIIFVISGFFNWLIVPLFIDIIFLPFYWCWTFWVLYDLLLAFVVLI